MRARPRAVSRGQWARPARRGAGRPGARLPQRRRTQRLPRVWTHPAGVRTLLFFPARLSGVPRSHPARPSAGTVQPRLPDVLARPRFCREPVGPGRWVSGPSDHLAPADCAVSRGAPQESDPGFPPPKSCPASSGRVSPPVSWVSGFTLPSCRSLSRLLFPHWFVEKVFVHREKLTSCATSCRLVKICSACFIPRIPLSVFSTIHSSFGGTFKVSCRFYRAPPSSTLLLLFEKFEAKLT